MKGPQFLRFCIPIVETLREMGGSGKSAEVTDAVIERLAIPESEQEETNKNDVPRIYNQVAWARLYLVKAEILDSAKRGVWTLTSTGKELPLDEAKVLELYKQVQRKYRKPVSGDDDESEDVSAAETEPTEAFAETTDYRTDLLSLLRSLPANGFERVCKALLQRTGFERVVVTGRSNDGGIDGHGVLQLNPFVSFKAIFQCKRYRGSVSSPQVRDFRGAMIGRADKGIILTTGVFTTEAKKEALRDGVPPIELVEGEDLVDMFAEYQLGLKPKQDFVVDREFFKQFQEDG